MMLLLLSYTAEQLDQIALVQLSEIMNVHFETIAEGNLVKRSNASMPNS